MINAHDLLLLLCAVFCEMAYYLRHSETGPSAEWASSEDADHGRKSDTVPSAELVGPARRASCEASCLRIQRRSGCHELRNQEGTP